MSLSKDGRWILCGGDDHRVRLWDTQSFPRKQSSSENQQSPGDPELTAAVAADAALGWECSRELMGHTAAVRDVGFNPYFKDCENMWVPLLCAEETATSLAGDSDPSPVKVEDGDRGVPANFVSAKSKIHPPAEKISPRLECMLASASTDNTLRIWDLSFSPRIPKCVYSPPSGSV